MLNNKPFRVSLIKLLVLLLSIALTGTRPVSAGYWQGSYSSQGTTSCSGQDSAGNSLNITGNWGPTGDYSYPSVPGSSIPGNYAVTSVTLSGTVTATLTWVPAYDIPFDPPPAKVALVEYAEALYQANYYNAASPFPASYYTGSASDGRGDPLIQSQWPTGINNFPGYSSGYSERNSTVDYTYSNNPMVVVDGSSGTIVRTCTLNASIQGAAKGGYCAAQCFFTLQPYGRPGRPLIGFNSTSDTENDLGWNKINFDNVPLTYNIYRSTSNASPGTLIGSSPTISYQDAGLQPNTQYYYYVTAVDQYGDESSPSNIVASTTDSITSYSDLVPADDGSITSSSPSTSSPPLVSFGEVAQAASPSPALPSRSFISGTNYRAVSVARVVGSGPNPLTIIGMVQKVNGKVVNRRVYPVGVLSYEVLTALDTTHYPDGTPIIVQGITYASDGRTYPSTKVYPVFNKASVYGNVKAFGDNDPVIQRAATNTYNTLSSPEMNHSATLSTSADKTAMLSSIPANTIFYVGTHAANDGFTDCTGSLSNTDTLFAFVDLAGNARSIADTVSQKQTQIKPYPDYNFVFIDGCTSAEYPDLSYAFGVNNQGKSLDDRAYLGWSANVGGSMDLAYWTTLMWNNLRLGKTLFEARAAANQKYPQPINSKGKLPVAKIYGDNFMKLRGLYQTKGLGYYKALP